MHYVFGVVSGVLAIISVLLLNPINMQYAVYFLGAAIVTAIWANTEAVRNK